MNAYTLLKLMHVLSVIVWVGAALTANLVTWRVARAGDRAALSTIFRHMTFVGRGLVGPAALLTLFTGIGTMMVGRVDGQALWIQWGFAGIVAHFLFGPLLLRRAGMELLAATTGGDDARFAAARRRVGWLNVVYMTLLLSVVAVMVIKPTL